ncbi:MAG: hypothetical protein ACR2PX_01700 [Endozoicomonas sp.]|uniref:hypothetical protein n=1 Tax=Endozoicomonas sp. TaxID=1892382 RepID=UPI003D9BBB85
MNPIQYKVFPNPASHARAGLSDKTDKNQSFSPADVRQRLFVSSQPGRTRLSSYQIQKVQKMTVSEAASLFEQANISFSDPHLKEKLVEFYLDASEGDRVQFWLSILSSEQHLSFKHWFSKTEMGLNFVPYCARAYQLLFSEKYPCLPIPLCDRIADDAPVNFI